jgi:hypothetical protein
VGLIAQKPIEKREYNDDNFLREVPLNMIGKERSSVINGPEDYRVE